MSPAQRRLLEAVRRLFRRKPRKNVVEEFIEAFGPDRCPACAFARFGFRQGLADTPIAEPHTGCPEYQAGRDALERET